MGHFPMTLIESVADKIARVRINETLFYDLQIISKKHNPEPAQISVTILRFQKTRYCTGTL